MKEALSKKNIEFEYVDTTDSMKNLKEFMKLRDKREEFEIARRLHRVGVPAMIVDDEVVLNITEEIIDAL